MAITGGAGVETLIGVITNSDSYGRWSVDGYSGPIVEACECAETEFESIEKTTECCDGQITRRQFEVWNAWDTASRLLAGRCL